MINFNKLTSIILSSTILLTFSSSFEIFAQDNEENAIIGESDNYIFGDVNDDDKLNVVDLLILKKHFLGLEDSSAFNYDVNSDGNINVIDLLLTKRKILQLNTNINLDDIPMYYKVTDEEINNFLLEHDYDIKGTEYIRFKVIDKEITLEDLGLCEEVAYISMYQKQFYDSLDYLNDAEMDFFDDSLTNHYEIYIDIDVKNLNRFNLARTYLSIIKSCPDIYSIGIRMV